jgi:hypothetical protein
MIGTKLAHYEIASRLGTGGMGELYQASDSPTLTMAATHEGMIIGPCKDAACIIPFGFVPG